MSETYIKTNEACREILKLIGNSETLFKNFGNDIPSFRSGAYWGMAMAMNYIHAYVPKYELKEKEHEKDSHSHPDWPSCRFCGRGLSACAPGKCPDYDPYGDGK